MGGVRAGTDVRTAPQAPQYFPTFDELHQRLYNIELDDADNSSHVIMSFSNPYGLRPSFNHYPHSNLLPDFIVSILDVIAPEGGPRFIVEAGGGGGACHSRGLNTSPNRQLLDRRSMAAGLSMPPRASWRLSGRPSGGMARGFRRRS